MKLYYFETPNARKACAVAKHLHAPVEFVRIDLASGAHKQPSFLDINPNGKVPALTDGDFSLWESDAIMCYLAHKAGSDMWPSDPLAQIEIVRWLNWNTAHFSRHASVFFYERLVKPHFGLGEPDAEAIGEASGFFKRFAAVLDGHLEGRDYVAGDSLSVADFALGSFLASGREAEMPLEGFTEIGRWQERLMALPAWRDPFPARDA